MPPKSSRAPAAKAVAADQEADKEPIVEYDRGSALTVGGGTPGAGEPHGGAFDQAALIAAVKEILPGLLNLAATEPAPMHAAVTPDLTGPRLATPATPLSEEEVQAAMALRGHPREAPTALTGGRREAIQAWGDASSTGSWCEPGDAWDIECHDPFGSQPTFASFIASSSLVLHDILSEPSDPLAYAPTTGQNGPLGGHSRWTGEITAELRDQERAFPHDVGGKKLAAQKQHDRRCLAARIGTLNQQRKALAAMDYLIHNAATSSMDDVINYATKTRKMMLETYNAQVDNIDYSVEAHLSGPEAANDLWRSILSNNGSMEAGIARGAGVTRHHRAVETARHRKKVDRDASDGFAGGRVPRDRATDAGDGYGRGGRGGALGGRGRGGGRGGAGRRGADKSGLEASPAKGGARK